MPDSFPVLGFTPAIKIIGRTIGKIFNGLYTVFAEGDEHSRRYTWNILKSVSTPSSFRLASKFNSMRSERRGSELGTKFV